MGTVTIAEYDPGWVRRFQAHAAIILSALGDDALRIEHIGSTAVPGLAAKPIVDILLVVANSADEASYVATIEAAGYELHVREPEFHEHRMFKTRERDVNLHVFTIGCPEIDRYLTFRDRLRHHADDRAMYERTKRTLAQQFWPDTDSYARAKSEIIERIIAAGFSERGTNEQAGPSSP
jgi:GrpB-like predicted nucleotidyltransferase (UPF0157 family)